jgi:hypothetical protein
MEKVRYVNLDTSIFSLLHSLAHIRTQLKFASCGHFYKNIKQIQCHSVILTYIINNNEEHTRAYSKNT